MYDSLQRGALAGAVGGGAYGLYVALVGNPLVAHAEELAHRGHEHAHEHAHSVVTEGVTQAVSIGSGVALGLLFGLVVFGVAGYLFEPALPDRWGSYLLGLGGFLTVSGVPWLVVPPSAPGVETSLSMEAGLSLYAGLMAVGAVACLGAGVTYHRFATRSQSLAVGAAVAVFATLVGLAVLVAPAPTYESTLPAAFESLYTGAVVLGQLGLWGITAATHARLEAAFSVDEPRVNPTAAD
jgi:hypothetical protein